MAWPHAGSGGHRNHGTLRRLHGPRRANLLVRLESTDALRLLSKVLRKWRFVIETREHAALFGLLEERHRNVQCTLGAASSIKPMLRLIEQLRMREQLHCKT